MKASFLNENSYPKSAFATSKVTNEVAQAIVVGTDQTMTCSLTSVIPNMRLTTQNKLSLK